MNSTNLLGCVHLLQNILRYTFGIVPIAAGIDKFFNLLTNWVIYLSPNIAAVVPFEPDTLMMIVGVIEILAGILVLRYTEWGAYIVTIWFIIISMNLILAGFFFDVAVRDLTMAVGAFSLGQLTGALEREKRNPAIEYPAAEKQAA